MNKWKRLTGLHFLSASLCLLLLAGCGSKDPFGYVKVSGRVMYDDDTPIPADLHLTFHPQAGPIDAKTHPRPGRAVADKATGEFSSVTSHMPNDGLVRGRHKVTLLLNNGHPLPPSIAAPEYSDPNKTSLEVDTANLPFVLKVKKPK